MAFALVAVVIGVMGFAYLKIRRRRKEAQTRAQV